MQSANLEVQPHSATAQTPPPVSHPLDRDLIVNDRRAAEILALSRSYLKQLRVRGGGPRYSRLAAQAIRYRTGDLLDWAASKLVGSTSEACQ